MNMNMETELISDLLEIVIGYLPKLDQYRVRVAMDQKMVPGKPAIENMNCDSFYSLFDDNEKPDSKDVFYKYYKSFGLSVQKFRNRFTINKKHAYILYEGEYVEKLFIRSKTLETLVIGVGRIKKIIIKAPKLVNLGIYGAESVQNYHDEKEKPAIYIPTSVKRFALSLNKGFDQRINKTVIRSYKKSGLFNIQEFYTDFEFFEDDWEYEEYKFINYINPEILWICSANLYCKKCLEKIPEFSEKNKSKLKMVIAPVG